MQARRNVYSARNPLLFNEAAQTYNALKHSFKSGSSWSYPEVIDWSTSIDGISVAADRGVPAYNIIHVSYVRTKWLPASGGVTIELRYAVLHVAIPNYWTTVTVTNLQLIGPYNDGFYSSIALDSNNNVYIEYNNYVTYDVGKVTMRIYCAYYNNPGWTILSYLEPGCDWQYTGGYLKLIIDKNNNQYISYEWYRYDAGYGTGLKYFMPVDYQRHTFSGAKSDTTMNGFKEWRERIIE